MGLVLTTKKQRIIVSSLFFFALGVFLFWRLFAFLQPLPGKTNFLILGVAGEGHAGGDLTDTIMFLSLDQQTAKTVIVSLPRDLWWSPLQTKLNSVYHYRGLDETKTIVGEILGQPVDYGLVLDFAVFSQIIDVLGGVEVEVVRTFDDDFYPILGKENDECGGDPEYRCRYEHLHFEKGKQKMDGQTALKYVRSRFAEGEEGTDFARSQRQQALVLAIKNKLFSWAIVGHPQTIWQLLPVVGKNVQTDFPQEKLSDLAKTFLRFRPEKLVMKVLADEFFFSPPLSQEYNYQWVLLPQTYDWAAVQESVSGLLD